MKNDVIEILVYGSEQKCASCTNLPSSQETASWLEILLSNKYGTGVRVRYIDIFTPTDNKKHNELSAYIIEQQLWYPVVVIEDKIVAEGSVQYRKIKQELSELGLSG